MLMERMMIKSSRAGLLLGGLFLSFLAAPVGAADVTVRITKPQDQSAAPPPVDISVFVKSTFQRPFAEPAAITSGFGPRTHPVTGALQKPHTGIDVDVNDPKNAAPLIRAAADGFIVSVSSDAFSGNFFLIYYPALDITVGYSHITHASREALKQRVQAAQRNVRSGEVIAAAGMTGRVKGVHVHLDVRPGLSTGRNFIDPTPFFNGTFANRGIKAIELAVFARGGAVPVFSRSFGSAPPASSTFTATWDAQGQPDGDYVIAVDVFGAPPSLLAHDQIAITLRRAPVAAGWTQFQHDAKHTGRSPAKGPDGTPSLRWSLVLGGGGTPPIVGPDGTIYTAVSGNLIAINPTGTIKWIFPEFGFGGPPVLDVSRNVLYGGKFGSPAGAVFAINAQDGREKWRVSIPGGGMLNLTLGPDGTIYGGVIRFVAPTSQTNLEAFDPEGRRKWAFVDRLPLSFPAVDDSSNIYFLNTRGELVALHKDGGLLWRQTARAVPGNFLGISVGDGRLFAPVFSEVGLRRHAIAAFSLGGARVWELTTGYHGQAAFGIAPGGTIYVPGRVDPGLVGQEAKGFSAVSPNGSVKWRKDLPSPPSGVAVDSDGNIYTVRSVFRAPTHELRSINAADGSDRWIFTTPISLVSAVPVLDDQGNLYAMNFMGVLLAFSRGSTAGTIGTLNSSLPAYVDVEPARLLINHKDGARVERADGTGVAIPGNALAADLEITVKRADETWDAHAKQAKRVEKKIQPVSKEIEYGPAGTTFNAPVTLVIAYNAAHVAAHGIKEDNLKIHYWNATLGDWEALSSLVDKTAKTVSASSTHFSVYQVLGIGGGIGVAAAEAALGFKAAYAFPNPVRGQNTATIRVQPGQADSVEVRVYDLSGRKVHASSNFSSRGAFDDGNGLGSQFTYDHVWDVSGVGSGVYTYTVTAKKTGQSDIVKTGKLGIVK